MPVPIHVRIRLKGPRIGGEVKHGFAIAAPTLLVKRDTQPCPCGAAVHRVDAESLPGRGGGPIRIALEDPVDRVVGTIDELADGGGGGIAAENICIEILPAGP